MSFFENIFKKLFPEGNNSRKTILHEVISRKKSESENYQNWLKSEKKDKQLAEIMSAYTLRKHDISTRFTILLHTSEYSNGFALTYNDYFSESEFRFIFDYFRDKVLKMNYRLANSDRKIKEKDNYIETIEKHYLKPPLTAPNQVSDQLYGNIMIEHISINDKPDYIKILANVYSDRNFLPARNFDEFIEKLFEDVANS
jgi:hypothetical protein